MIDIHDDRGLSEERRRQLDEFLSTVDHEKEARAERSSIVFASAMFVLLLALAFSVVGVLLWSAFVFLRYHV
jgi:hypothetical protein